MERNATTEADLRRIFASLKKGEVDGVAIASPNLITKFPLLIMRLSSERRLPLGSHRKAMIHEGALFSSRLEFVIQPQDRQGARAHDPALSAGARGSSDRVTPLP